MSVFIVKCNASLNTFNQNNNPMTINIDPEYNPDYLHGNGPNFDNPNNSPWIDIV